MEELRDEKVDLEIVSTDLVYEGAVWDVKIDFATLRIMVLSHYDQQNKLLVR